MSLSAKSTFFDNYTRMTPRLRPLVWTAARLLVLAITFGLATALALWPATGLRLFWGLAIPIVPLLLVAAPGLWRQVCPMAFLNQIPRMTGFSRGLDLPEKLRNTAFSLALIIFIGCVALRVPLLNHDGTVVAAGIVLVLILAFVGGYIFKGRSGWCGTFCPLGPIQRVYGQAPVVVVRNGYCAPCLGCQKNCYDFNPRAAIFSDIYDDDPRYAGQRRLFMGLLPGLILGYFTQSLIAPGNTPAQLLVLFSACCASTGFYSLLISFAPVNPYRISVVFGAAALIIFYFFAGPIVVGTISWLIGTNAAGWLETLSQATGGVAALILAASGLRSEHHYRKSMRDSEVPRLEANRQAIQGAAAAAGSGPQATDRGSGTTFDVPAGVNLLDAIQGAGLKINYGCRSGVCGADAVAVLDGAANLSPAGPDELATLRRLGLEGKARLACVCQVTGPILIDRDPKSAPGPAVQKQVTTIDLAKINRLGRVVIIGNGIAGITVAEALRRDSPSLAITIVTNEPSHFYNRMAIGRLVYGGSGMDGMQLIPDSWYADNDITVLRNTIAVRIDRDGRSVQLATRETLAFDKLVLATGARSSVPAPDFLARRNAFVLRSVEDAQAIRAFAQINGAKRACVIGGGVLGVEAADALNHLGLQVIILQRSDRLMNAQLEPTGASKLAQYLDGIGIQTVVNTQVLRFEGEDRINAAWLDHGPRIRADLYVACLGIDTNKFLAEQAGLDTARGIRVNNLMQTSDPDIYAVGDVAELKGHPSGLWPVASAHAATAAASIFGNVQPYTGSSAVLRLKCDGIDVYSFGVIKPGGHEVIHYRSPAQSDAWWILATSETQILGGQFVGPPGSGRGFAKLLQVPGDTDALKRFLNEAGAVGLQIAGT